MPRVGTSMLLRGGLIAAAIAAMLALRTPASAGEWLALNHELGKFLVYLDPASVSRAGGVVRAKILFDFAQPQDSLLTFKEFRSATYSLMLRCADRSYLRVKKVEYSAPHAQGKVVAEQDWKPNGKRYEKEVPFTNSQAVVDYLCQPGDTVLGDAPGGKPAAKASGTGAKPQSLARPVVPQLTPASRGEYPKPA